MFCQIYYCRYFIFANVNNLAMLFGMQQTVLAAQAVQMQWLIRLRMLTFKKLAVVQALRVYIPKISTVWEKNSTSMLAMLAAFTSLLYTGCSWKSQKVQKTMFWIFWSLSGDLPYKSMFCFLLPSLIVFIREDHITISVTITITDWLTLGKKWH